MAQRSSSAARRRRQRSRLNKQTLMSMGGVGFVVLALFLVLGIKSLQLREKNAAYEKTISQLQEEIAQEEERAEEIESYSAYVSSDEYIEKIARERLGLINENEIIFYSGTEENGGATEAPATDAEDETDADSADDAYDEE